MQIQITKPDTTSITIEGTIDEIQKILPTLLPQPMPLYPSFWYNPADSALHWTMGTVGCEHDFPSPWFGTLPPSCKKCGQQALWPYTYGSTTATVTTASAPRSGWCWST